MTNDSERYDSFIMAEPVDTDSPSPKSEVTFKKYGTTLVLKQIWINGNNTTYIVFTSYAEKKASNTGKPTKVSIPAQKK
jgi:hypothetical protein